MTAPAFSRCEFGIVGRARGEGRAGSAIAASAYNLCAALAVEDGRRFDFSRKHAEHVGGTVLLPPGAPPELRDPGALWRAAESAEHRVDAQLARQVLLSVPREVPADLRLAWVEAIAAPWVEAGMAVQIDLHAPLAADGAEQPHAHVLLSLRRVTEGGFAKAKAREWNQQFREDGAKAERARIQTRANAWLEAHGIPCHLDLRSLAAQGEDRPPEPSAPRADWQRWVRDGADPAAAPITVRAALQHRGRRTALAAAEFQAAAAAAEAADLQRQLAGLVKAAPAMIGSPHAPPRPTPAAERRAAAEAAWQACRAQWQAERSAPTARADRRGRPRGERIATRADELVARWTAPPRPTLDQWLATQAAAGHPEAAAVLAARADADRRRAARDPAGAARRAQDIREREARAVLAAPPPDAEALEARATVALARATERREAAAQAAQEARQAARAQARKDSLLGLGLVLFGRKAAEQGRLAGEARRLARRAEYAARDYTEESEAVRLAQQKAGPLAEAARRAWLRGPAAAAHEELARVVEERCADRAASTSPPPAETAQSSDPRADAIRNLAAAEQQVRNPAALARARATTAAAVAGDPETVAAAAHGDLAAAQRAAEEFRERQRQEEQRRRDRAAVLARAPQQPHAAGPGR